jgi:hypothetical protein
MVALQVSISVPFAIDEQKSPEIEMGTVVVLHSQSRDRERRHVGAMEAGIHGVQSL